MRKSKQILLAIAPLLALSACDDAPEQDTERDVYNSRDECLQDWGDDELCKPMGDDDREEYRRSGGVIVVGHPYYWGPNYYPGDRTVVYNGRTISPSRKSSTMKTFPVTSTSSASSRTSSSSPRTTHGGFGGRSSGISS